MSCLSPAYIFTHYPDLSNFTKNGNNSFLNKNFFFEGGATPAANGGFQARGLIGATAAGLHHSHSN